MMEKKALTLLSGVLAICLVTALLFASGAITGGGGGEYDPWLDTNDDGKIRIDDVLAVALAFGADGTALTKASITYDSGWLDITDKAGQYFNVTHTLNSTDVIVDITGKTTIDGGAHQRHLGGTGYTPGWIREYGGTGIDNGAAVIETDDGGLAISGSTTANGLDLWFMKTDALGNVLLNKTYGDAGYQTSGYNLMQTSDGYVLCGYTNSPSAGGYDAWLLKIDINGNVLWNKTYGGPNDDSAVCFVETSDHGYAISGTTSSYGDRDIWLIKTDSNGNMQWNKTYSSPGTDACHGPKSVIQTSDGGYALVGSLNNYAEGWFVKTDASGNQLWNRTYGTGTRYEHIYSVLQMSDGRFVLAAGTGPVYTDMDGWLIETDSDGNEVWSKRYGGGNSDRFDDIVQTSDGGYALTGPTYSFTGSCDGWIVKTDSNGNMQWYRVYGEATSSEVAYAMTKTRDGGFVIIGATNRQGNENIYMVKTDSNGNPYPGFKFGLALTDSTTNTITLYRGATDAYWNYVRVRIWKIRETP